MQYFKDALAETSKDAQSVLRIFFKSYRRKKKEIQMRFLVLGNIPKWFIWIILMLPTLYVQELNFSLCNSPVKKKFKRFNIFLFLNMN